MDFSIRCKAAHAKAVVGRADHASAMRAVAEAVFVPGLRAGLFVDDVETMADLVQVLVRGGGARIDDSDLDPLAAVIGGQLVELGVFFDGVTATAVPALIELVKSTNATNSSPGTNNTTVTPVQARGDGNTAGAGVAPAFTAFSASTSEPTVLVVLKRWLVPPTSGLLVQAPLGREPAIIPIASTFMGLGLRVTAPATVNVRAYMEFIQGPS